MIIKGDCLQAMPNLPEGATDLILTDLPYGSTSRNQWDTRIPLAPLWTQYKRLIKPNGAVVLFADMRYASTLIASSPISFRYDIVWEKPLAAGFLNANRMPLRAHELILVFYQSLPTYNPQFSEGKPYQLTRRGDTNNYGSVANLHHTTQSDGKRYPRSVIKFAHDSKKLLLPKSQ